MVKISRNHFFELKAAFPQNLRYLMKRDDITIEKLLKDFNIPPVRYENWVKGNRYPASDTLKRLTDLYNWKYEELLEDQSHCYIDVLDIKDIYDIIFNKKDAEDAEKSGKLPFDVRFLTSENSYAVKNFNNKLEPFNTMNAEVYFIINDINTNRYNSLDWNLLMLYDIEEKNFIVKWIKQVREPHKTPYYLVGDSQDTEDTIPRLAYFSRYAKIGVVDSIQIIPEIRYSKIKMNINKDTSHKPYTEQKYEFPCNLLRLMKIHSMTFSDFAASIDSTERKTKKWRNGNGHPDQTELENIENVYGWTREDLYGTGKNEFVDYYSQDDFVRMFQSGKIEKEYRTNALKVDPEKVDIKGSFIMKNTNNCLQPYSAVFSNIGSVYFILTDLYWLKNKDRYIKDWHIELLYNKKEKTVEFKWISQIRNQIMYGDSQTEYKKDQLNAESEFSETYFRIAAAVQTIILPDNME